MMNAHSSGGSQAGLLKQKLLEALQASSKVDHTVSPVSTETDEQPEINLAPNQADLGNGKTVYSLLQDAEDESYDAALTPELSESARRLTAEIASAQEEAVLPQMMSEPAGEKNLKNDDTLSLRGVVEDAKAGTIPPRDKASFQPPNTDVSNRINMKSVISGGSMADLSGYKDLSRAPMPVGEEDSSTPAYEKPSGFESAPERAERPERLMGTMSTPLPQFQQESLPQEVDTEFSGNVKTLIRLVNELPEGVTKQTGAQIIRLTMEAMGISMEDVLSEAQAAQSEMLDAVRANIKKIEEYKTVIRKLETDIKYYQGKANELSEIIDLFILSNTSGNKPDHDEERS